jgi:hypothetical protein
VGFCQPIVADGVLKTGSLPGLKFCNGTATNASCIILNVRLIRQVLEEKVSSTPAPFAKYPNSVINACIQMSSNLEVA